MAGRGQGERLVEQLRGPEVVALLGAALTLVGEGHRIGPGPGQLGTEGRHHVGRGVEALRHRAHLRPVAVDDRDLVELEQQQPVLGAAGHGRGLGRRGRHRPGQGGDGLLHEQSGPACGAHRREHLRAVDGAPGHVLGETGGAGQRLGQVQGREGGLRGDGREPPEPAHPRAELSEPEAGRAADPVAREGGGVGGLRGVGGQTPGRQAREPHVGRGHGDPAERAGRAVAGQCRLGLRGRLPGVSGGQASPRSGAGRGGPTRPARAGARLRGPTTSPRRRGRARRRPHGPRGRRWSRRCRAPAAASSSRPPGC